MNKLKRYVDTFVQPTEKEWQYFVSLVKKEAVSKGKNIVKAGSRNDKMYFVNSGILRYIISQPGKEKTIALAMENDLVTDFFSFYSGLPSITTVQALTEAELYFLTIADLEQLYQSAATWERFGRLLAQKGLLEQIMEKLDLQTKTAEQRYKELIVKKPNLLEEVTLGVLASCLNITQETLSRIRSRI
jgi:CRP-like cAMP-binding protein